MANISHIPKLIASKLGISLQFCVYLTLVKNGKYLTYPKIYRKQTWNFPSVLSIFNFKCKIINQNVVINGSDVIDTSDKGWIVQNGNISLIPKLIVSKLGISV